MWPARSVTCRRPDTEGVNPSMHSPAYDGLPARLLAKLDFTVALPCYICTASTNRERNGYTQTMLGSVQKVTHRWVWELLVGPIAAGLKLDHLCRNTRCVRIEHLEPVPQRINILRGVAPAAIQARRTQCIRGHPLSGKNLLLWSSGRRVCRTCQRIRRAKQHSSPLDG
jgi:hypothetical protein